MERRCQKVKLAVTEASGFDRFDHLPVAEIKLHFSPAGPEKAEPGTCQFKRLHPMTSREYF